MSAPRELRLLFLAQLEDYVPVPLRTADDLLNLPIEIRHNIQRDLAIEEAVEAQQRTETDR